MGACRPDARAPGRGRRCHFSSPQARERGNPRKSIPPVLSRDLHPWDSFHVSPIPREHSRLGTHHDDSLPVHTCDRSAGLRDVALTSATLSCPTARCPAEGWIPKGILQGGTSGTRPDVPRSKVARTGRTAKARAIERSNRSHNGTRGIAFASSLLLELSSAAVRTAVPTDHGRRRTSVQVHTPSSHVQPPCRGRLPNHL